MHMSHFMAFSWIDGPSTAGVTRPARATASPGASEAASVDHYARTYLKQHPPELSRRSGRRRLSHRMRHPHRERRPLAVDAGDGDVAAHHAAEMARDGEAQAGPAVLAPRARFRLGERLEQPGELLLGHANARV